MTWAVAEVVVGVGEGARMTEATGCMGEEGEGGEGVMRTSLLLHHLLLPLPLDPPPTHPR